MCNYYKAFFLKLVNFKTFGVDIIKVEWEATELFFSGFRKRGLMRDYFCPVRSSLVKERKMVLQLNPKTLKGQIPLTLRRKMHIGCDGAIQ